MNGLDNYKHLVEIEIKSVNKNSINKNFDRLLNDSVLTGLNTHYLDEKNNKLYLAFNHLSSKPEARLKSILKDFNTSIAKHTVFDNIRQNEIATGNISIKKKIKFSFSKGVSIKERIKSDLNTHIIIENNPNISFNKVKDNFDMILNKSNQIENTLFHNPDRIKDLSEFNKLKLNSFINNFPNLVKDENIIKLKKIFKPHEVLTTKNVIEQVNKNNLQNINNMVIFGYNASEQLIDNISKSTSISDEKKVALFSILKPERNQLSKKYNTKDKVVGLEKNIENNLPKKDKGLNM